MFDCQHFPIFLLFLTCVEVRCGYHPGDYEPFGFHNPCHTETEVALEEIKSAVEDLKNLVVGLRQKIDPDFKLPQPDTGNCPSGFTYLPMAKSCYKVVYESHNWTSAAQRCQDIRSGSHLVAITSATENILLKKFLASELSANEGNTACVSTDDYPNEGNLLWTSGQRLIENSCQTPFVWKLSSDQNVPFAFTNWQSGEPSCGQKSEFCMDIAAKKNFGWNDISCEVKICPLCEYKP